MIYWFKIDKSFSLNIINQWYKIKLKNARWLGIDRNLILEALVFTPLANLIGFCSQETMRKDSYFSLIDSTSISCIDPEGSFSWIHANYRESLRERLRLQANRAYYTSRKISWLTNPTSRFWNNNGRKDTANNRFPWISFDSRIFSIVWYIADDFDE